MTYLEVLGKQENQNDAINQLLARAAELQDARLKISDLEKKIKSLEDTQKYLSKTAEDAKAEIEQVHLLLDVLPGAPGRKGVGTEEWSRPSNSAMTRLAGFLAIRG